MDPSAVSPDGRRRATLKLTDWVGVRPSRVLVTFGCGKGTPKRAERPGRAHGERERPAARPVDPNRRIGSVLTFEGVRTLTGIRPRVAWGFCRIQPCQGPGRAMPGSAGL